MSPCEARAVADQRPKPRGARRDDATVLRFGPFAGVGVMAGARLLVAWLALASVGIGVPGHALTLDFPGTSTTMAERSAALGSYQLPVGPWRAGKIERLATEGAVQLTAWRVDIGGLTTLQLLAPLRMQVVAAGYSVLFECDTAACGGFDFRYQTEVLPEPEMHVDLGDFRYLAAMRRDARATVPDYIGLIVSRSAENGYVQMVEIGATRAAPPPLQPSGETPVTLPLAPAGPPETSEPDAVALADGSLAAALETGGSVPLDDLSFATGSADLAAGDFASLRGLAAYLAAHPDRTVTLVGHTDASGGLDANIALSKRRAIAVRDRLTGTLGVVSGQISAQGVGYLAPRASNLTDAGRSRNRRVEAVLTSTR